MPRNNLPKGVHRVRRKVVSGVRYHFYAWRGGPKFWEGIEPNPKAPEFFHAFSQCGMPISPAEYLTTQLVDDFLSSASLPKAERSKADIRACGQSGFPLGLISDSNFQNGGLHERATFCGDGSSVAAT